MLELLQGDLAEAERRSARLRDLAAYAREKLAGQGDIAVRPRRDGDAAPSNQPAPRTDSGGRPKVPAAAPASDAPDGLPARPDDGKTTLQFDDRGFLKESK